MSVSSTVWMNNVELRHNSLPTSYPNHGENGIGQLRFFRRLTSLPTLCTACPFVGSVYLTGYSQWSCVIGNPEGNKEREWFADAINRAAFGNERVLLRRRGRAVAAVVPIDDLRLLEALEDRIDLVEAREAPAQANKNGARSLDVMLKELGF
jgi:hypothetical protein